MKNWDRDNVDMRSGVFSHHCGVLLLQPICSAHVLCGPHPFDGSLYSTGMNRKSPDFGWRLTSLQVMFDCPKMTFMLSALCSGVLGNYEMMKYTRNNHVIQSNQRWSLCEINHLQNMTSWFFIRYISGCVFQFPPDLVLIFHLSSPGGFCFRQEAMGRRSSWSFRCRWSPMALVLEGDGQKLGNQPLGVFLAA